MSELQVLATVRNHLLNRQAAAHVHLAAPPKADYPLVLIELEEAWSNLGISGNGIQGRLKFRATICSHMPHWGEASLIADKVRNALEGVTLWLPENQRATLRFLLAKPEALVDKGQPLTVCQFYDAVIFGEAR